MVNANTKKKIHAKKSHVVQKHFKLTVLPFPKQFETCFLCYQFPFLSAYNLFGEIHKLTSSLWRLLFEFT